MGHDTGTDPDTPGSTAFCLYHEYSAQCQPDHDRSGSTGLHNRQNRTECALLSPSEPQGQSFLAT